MKSCDATNCPYPPKGPYVFCGKHLDEIHAAFTWGLPDPSIRWPVPQEALEMLAAHDAAEKGTDLRQGATDQHKGQPGE